MPAVGACRPLRDTTPSYLLQLLFGEDWQEPFRNLECDKSEYNSPAHSELQHMESGMGGGFSCKEPLHHMPVKSPNARSPLLDCDKTPVA